MKEKIETVVFQVTKKCNQFCPHCFFDASPSSKKELTIEEALLGIKDLENAGIKKIKKIIISGGEPTIWSGIHQLIQRIRLDYPLSKIRIDTNGLTFLQNPELFNTLRADIYDISVDLFHNQGSINKEELFIKRDGTSTLIDYFIKQKRKYKFKLFVRWTSNRNDSLLFKKLLNKYSSRVNIEKKFVTATGRGNLLPRKMRGKGYLISEKSNNFTCLMGDTMFLAVNGYWYGCYHPVSFAKICKAGDLNFKKRLKGLIDSLIYKKLSREKILTFLNYLKKNRHEYKIAINKLIKKRYWYRCQPCEEAAKNNIFKKEYG
jgi:organic radical activating enzyme